MTTLSNPPWQKHLPSLPPTNQAIFKARDDCKLASLHLSEATYQDRRRRAKLAASIKWVTLTDIIEFLIQQGYGIKYIKKDKDKALYNRQYVVNGQCKTAHQVVVMANKLRLEKGLLCYCVENITYE